LPSGAEPQGVKELDDNYIGHATAAGTATRLWARRAKVTGIELRFTAVRTAAARAECHAHPDHHLDLETRDFAELTPFYGQA
jgi:hypothetical protein